MAFKSMAMKVTALLIASAVFSSVAAQAADWTAREAELVGLHQLCDKGDRKACALWYDARRSEGASRGLA